MNFFLIELTTVKKGTPLYGQPAWWGEPDDAEDDPAISNKKSCAYEKTDHGSCKLCKYLVYAYFPM